MMNLNMMEELKGYLQQRDEAKLKELIISHPQVLDEKDANGSSGFMLIAYSFLPAVLETASSLKREFSFHEAIVADKADLVRVHLAKEPGLANSYSSDGFPALTLAAFFQRAQIAGILLRASANPNLHAANPSKVNALHSAVAREDMEISRMLIEAGIDVNARQMAGVTALHSAAHRGNLELVKLLISNGADASLQMDDGSTALDFAVKDGHHEVQEYLRQRIAGTS